MTDHPLKPTEFLKYIDTPYQSYVLPIAPAGAKLKETSNLSADHLGKIPGRYDAEAKAWTGFAGWQKNDTKPMQLERWQKWQGPDQCGVAIALALNTRWFPALDVDSDDKAYVECVWQVANRHFDETPAVRCRDGSVRIVLFYKHKDHTPPIRKFCTVFEDEDGNKHIVEFLAAGQQVVAEGPHSKGKMHYWHNENGGLVAHVGRLPEVDVERVDAFFRELEEISTALFSFTKIKLSLPTHSDRAAAVTVDNLMSPHMAKNRELLARAIKEIDINSPKLADYNTWCALFRAIKAACAGDPEFYTQHVWPWLARNPDNASKEEEMLAKWDSFKDSQLGYEYVYDWAAQFGFNEGRQAIAQEFFEHAPTTETANGAGDQTSDGSSEGGHPPSNGSPGGSSGPTPFPYTDMALADRFAAEHPDWKFAPDEGWMRLENGVFVPNPNITYPIGQMCSAIGDPYRSQGPQQAVLDVMLKGSKKHAAVERVLRAHPSMFVRPESFDTDPWLLNTPGFIMDLRTGERISHEEALQQGLLFRHQTAVTPDVLAYGGYENACPRFLEALHNMTEDEQDIALLGRHGAAGLVGTDLTQVLLFIYGQGGTGKSAFSDILIRVEGTYGSAGSTSLFMKQNDKRPFELGDIAQARALFVPETLKGMTWDDALICAMLGGTPIRVERKRRDSKSVRVFMTITITGNHLPHFITSSQPNKSGIDRRLLLLKVDKLLPGKPDDHFARKLVADEGPAILMWFIQHAMEGYQALQADGSFYGDTTVKAKAAAEAYKARMSPHLAWMEDEDIILEPGARMNAHQAWKSYKEWIRDDNPLHRETKEEFRGYLRDATKGAVTYGRFGDERIFHGMRPKNAPSGVNVVPFPPAGSVKDCVSEPGEDAKK